MTLSSSGRPPWPPLITRASVPSGRTPLGTGSTTRHASMRMASQASLQVRTCQWIDRNRRPIGQGPCVDREAFTPMGPLPLPATGESGCLWLVDQAFRGKPCDGPIDLLRDHRTIHVELLQERLLELRSAGARFEQLP